MSRRQETQCVKAVYTIVDRPPPAKKLWLRIGSAFLNRDGSYNVRLDAVPTNGTIHIRDRRHETARRLSLVAEQAEPETDRVAGGRS